MAGRAQKVAKRTESLVVRLTGKEVEMVREIAARRGKTVSEWVREQIYNAPEKDAANLWRTAQEPTTFTLKKVVRPKQEPRILKVRRADLASKEPNGKRHKEKEN